jgi:anti-sigma regulatory factor (Ser/Thr protein kinase)
MSPAQASLPGTLGAPDHNVGIAVRLPRSTSAAHGARHIVKQRFGELLAEQMLDDALLVVSELVTNAVLHGTGDIELRLAFDGQRLTGEVTDEGILFTGRARELDRHEAGGRGLDLVGSIADTWGLRERSARVWFEILVQRPL